MSFYRREDCVPCSNDPVCNCASDERCILTSRTCSQCPTIQCIKNQSSSGGGGINPGAIAGPVVAVLVIASLALFWWMRRKKRRDLERLEDLAKRARKAEATSLQLSHPGSPQPSSAHSASLRSYNASQLPQPPPSASRRSARSPLPPAPVNAEYYDENGTTIRVYNGNGTINADPNYRDEGPSGRNPFSDRQSISTMGTSSTQSTNIIPIQYIPPSRSEDGLSHAAKTLDEARQNLLKPRGAPQRPARSPELDLRLNPPAQQGGDGSRSRVRESFLSENSAAPSFLSGNSYDVYNDAPKIVTSKQVHVGRYQQAEVVQLGRDGSNPLNYHNLTIPTTAATSNQIRSPSPTMTFGSRALTPNSPASVHGRGYEREMEEGLRADEPPSAGASSGDLRFSMGSLGYRDSMSTVGTSRYLARPDGTYSQDHSNSSASSVSRVPPPRSASNQTFSHLGPEGRESMFSTKSNADSFLSGFPMIPPGQQGGPPPLPTNALPQSTSAMTLNNASLARPSAPPVSFRHPQAAGGQPPSRPITQASVADSLLGSFPFVPPNLDDLAELPSANLPTGATPDTAKR